MLGRLDRSVSSEKQHDNVPFRRYHYAHDDEMTSKPVYTHLGVGNEMETFMERGDAGLGSKPAPFSLALLNPPRHLIITKHTDLHRHKQAALTGARIIRRNGGETFGPQGECEGAGITIEQRKKKNNEKKVRTLDNRHVGYSTSRGGKKMHLRVGVETYVDGRGVCIVQALQKGQTNKQKKEI